MLTVNNELCQEKWNYDKLIRVSLSRKLHLGHQVIRKEFASNCAEHTKEAGCTSFASCDEHMKITCSYTSSNETRSC